MQLALGLTLREDATFSNFFSGPNEEVVHYLKKIIAGHYERSVYIWGALGSGRSHLLQAICHNADKCNISSIYLPLVELVEMSPEVLAGLESYRFVCVDDIDAIAGHKKWEEALFHLYNRILEAKGSLIVTAEKPLAQTNIELSDLTSRLGWGGVYQIKPLHDDEKMIVLQLKAKTKGLDLPNSVASYLIRHCSRELSDLFNILTELDHASLVAQRKLTIPFIKEILKLR